MRHRGPSVKTTNECDKLTVLSFRKWQEATRDERMEIYRATYDQFPLFADTLLYHEEGKAVNFEFIHAHQDTDPTCAKLRLLFRHRTSISLDEDEVDRIGLYDFRCSTYKPSTVPFITRIEADAATRNFWYSQTPRGRLAIPLQH